MSRVDTFKYPAYLVWRDRTNILLTAPRSICLSYLLAESYCLNSAVASEKDRCSLAMTAAVAPEVIIAAAPGLTGETKTVSERVL